MKSRVPTKDLPPPPALPAPDDFQQTFFARYECAGQICHLFNVIEGVCVFIKDRESRIVALGDGPNQELIGNGAAIIGLTDYAFFPRAIAERLRADDLQVMETGQPLLNIVEILVNPKYRTIGWYVTNKFPLRDRDGTVIGLMGAVQPLETRRKLRLTGTRLDDVLDFIDTHSGGPLETPHLASLAGLSMRHFRRRFQEALGLSPQEFILRTRLMKACKSLSHSTLPLSDIAQQHGFYDQSAFSKQFRKIIGQTPLDYRKSYSASPSGRLGR